MQNVFDIDISSTDSDSEDDLARLVAISPRAKPTMSTFNPMENQKSPVSQISPRSKAYEILKQKAKIDLSESDSDNVPNLETQNSDSSDEEFTVIEQGIQMSLDQVKNRIRGLNYRTTA